MIKARFARFLVFIVAAGMLQLMIPEAVAQQEPIKVGVALSLSGTLSRSGEKMSRGYQLWVQDLNARGGLLGRPVKLVIYDDQSDSGTCARLYEKLITEDKVDLVVGPYGSPQSFAASAVAEKYKFPIILPSSASDAIFNRGFKYAFQMFPPIRTIFEPLFGEAGAAAGYQRIAIVHSSDLYPKSVASAVEALAQKYHRTVVLNEEFPLNASDLSSIALKIRAARPDLIIAGAQLPDGLLLVRQLKDVRFVPKAMAITPAALNDDFYKGLGPDAEGVMGDFLWEPVSKTPESEELIRKWKAVYKDEPDMFSAYGWSAGKLLEAAVRQAGTLDSEKVRAAFLGLNVTTLLPGKFKLNPENGKQVGQTLGVVQWQKGIRQIVFPKEIATSTLETPLAPWDHRESRP